MPTPGHTADSLSFHLPADARGADRRHGAGARHHVVAHPDGRLGDYLDSLRRLRSLTVDDGVATVLPGHGPVLDDAQGAVEFYLAHRAHRLAQVETAVEAGPPHARRGRRRTSTPTWTGRCGRRPSCRCGRSWTTCGEHGLIEG